MVDKKPRSASTRDKEARKVKVSPGAHKEKGKTNFGAFAFIGTDKFLPELQKSLERALDGHFKFEAETTIIFPLDLPFFQCIGCEERAWTEMYLCMR